MDKKELNHLITVFIMCLILSFPSMVLIYSKGYRDGLKQSKLVQLEAASKLHHEVEVKEIHGH